MSRAVDPATNELVPGNTFFQMDSEGQNVRQVVARSDAAFVAASANADWVVYTSRAAAIPYLESSAQGGDPVQLTEWIPALRNFSRRKISRVFHPRER
jgi:hypothetical protein